MEFKNNKKLDINIDRFLYIYESLSNNKWPVNGRKNIERINKYKKTTNTYNFCFVTEGDFITKSGKDDILIKNNALILRKYETDNRSNTLPYRQLSFDFTTHYPINCPLGENTPYIVVYPKDILLINNIFTKIMVLYTSKSPVADAEIKSQIYKLCAIFFSLYYKLENEKNLPSIVKNAYYYIIDYYSMPSKLNIKEPLKVSELAEKYHVTIDYFIRLFKKHLNITPKQFINDVMLERASSMLQTSDKSIAEIVDIMHFSSCSNFSKMFREKYNVTPSKYRSSFNNFD